MEKDKVFEENPSLEVYYKTSDNIAFYQESDAKQHAKALENKEVTPVFRNAISMFKEASSRNQQEQKQKSVETDRLNALKSEDEKEAEEKAKQEAEAKAKQEAEEKAKKEAGAKKTSDKKSTPKSE